MVKRAIDLLAYHWLLTVVCVLMIVLGHLLVHS